EEVEPIFAEAGASLFPAKAKDLEMRCSCPDYAVPCKHVAAVHYLLAEEIDRDPFLLFTLRGKDREAVLEGLREAQGMAQDPGAVLRRLGPPDFASEPGRLQRQLDQIYARVSQRALEASLESGASEANEGG